MSKKQVYCHSTGEAIKERELENELVKGFQMRELGPHTNTHNILTDTGVDDRQRKTPCTIIQGLALHSL